MMLILTAIAVLVLPIQKWTDAMPKGSAGMNFQNLITLALVIGWIIQAKWHRKPILAKNELNKWLGLYLLWSFLALYYGVIFTPGVAVPTSLADDRLIHWKDEATGILMFFIVANCMRTEKSVRKLVFLMMCTIPYIMSVYYDQYHSPSSKKAEIIQPEDIVYDDEMGTHTQKAHQLYFRLEYNPIIDDDHGMKVVDSDGNNVFIQAYHGNKTVQVFGFDPKINRTLSVSYYQDRGGGAAAAQEFSWDLKEITGVFTHIGSNEMAAFYVQAFLFAVGLIFAMKSIRWRLYLVINCLFLGWGILFSLSRGAWLAVIAAFGYLGARRSKGLMVFFVIFLLAAPAVMPGSVSSRASGSGDDGSGAHRLDFWKWAVTAGTVRYPLGLGYQCYIPKHADETGIKLDTHNFFFRTIAEMGLFGLFLVGMIFRGAFRNGWQLFENGKTGFARGVGLGVAIMVIGSAVANMFGDRFSYVSLGAYLWAFIGMAARLNQLYPKQEVKPAPKASEAPAEAAPDLSSAARSKLA